MPMQATVDALERLSDFEELDRSMQADYAGATLEDASAVALVAAESALALEAKAKRARQSDKSSAAEAPRGKRSVGLWLGSPDSICVRSVRPSVPFHLLCAGSGA